MGRDPLSTTVHLDKCAPFALSTGLVEELDLARMVHHEPHDPFTLHGLLCREDIIHLVCRDR